ncbi:MAG: phosphoglycerate mutase family protein [Bacteroidales bacterium]|nr:phosphoglycerate mutase family protein [Bacteroidales bacterium]
MEDIFALAQQNQQAAKDVLQSIKIMELWQSIGAEVNLIGSLKTGLLMKHLDIDMHLYTPTIHIEDDFKVMTRLACTPNIQSIMYNNLLDTEEACLEWHAFYKDQNNRVWQLDMMHIAKNSKYDGYFEKVADRIMSIITPEQKKTILQLKYDTPDNEPIGGIEYYKAVIESGIDNYADFQQWRKAQPAEAIIEWMP